MTGPDQFRDVLEAADILSSSDKVQSVFQLLEIMTPILRTTLSQHSFPSVHRYGRACASMMGQITACMALFDDFMFRSVWDEDVDHQITWVVPIKEHQQHFTDRGTLFYRDVVIFKIRMRINWKMGVEPKFSGETVIFGERELDVLHRAVVDDTFVIPMNVLEHHIFGRMRCSPENYYTFSPSIDNIYIDQYEFIGWWDLEAPAFSEFVQIAYKGTTFDATIHPFVADSVASESETFISRASLSRRVGRHAADHVRYRPLEEGYDEAEAAYKNASTVV